MKKFIVLCLILIPTLALATSTSKLGFRAYSTPTSVECGVKGADTLVYGPGSHPYQGFAPDADFDRTLTLGTKGMANYSTTLGGRRLGAVKFTCRNVGTSTAARVKVFLNGVETHFLTVSDDIFYIK